MDNNEKLRRIARKIDIYASDGKVRYISHEEVRGAIIDASHEWGRVITSHGAKRDYINTLLDLQVLQPSGEKGVYRFDADILVQPSDVAARRRLSDPQVKAVRLLAQGSSDQAAARELGVDRTTIYRWRTANRDFIAEMGAAKDAQIRTASPVVPEEA